MAANAAPASPNQPVGATTETSNKPTAAVMDRKDPPVADLEKPKDNQTVVASKPQDPEPTPVVSKGNLKMGDDDNTVGLKSHPVQGKKNKGLTYFNSKNSDAYNMAKACLAAGEFESALETIETQLTTNMSMLPHADSELHESLAPLHYLYGTTLLYSIEEGPTDDAAALAVMQQQEGDEPQDGAPNAEDLQIAWENLEIARAVLTRMTEDDLSSKLPGNMEKSVDDADKKMSPEAEERILDLAQVHMRLGDLQKANGNYASCIEDHQQSLDLRTQILGLYDRKVADAHYSLASSYLLLAAEGDKSSDPPGAPAVAAAASAGGSDETPAMSVEQISECRDKSMKHILLCGQAFAGLIANLCGQGPIKMSALDTSPVGVASAQQGDLRQAASEGLATIRQRVKSLISTKLEDADTVCDLREMLDEMQETVDTTEEDRVGLRDVSAMKAQAEADADAKHNDISPPGSENEPVTTIGFGDPTGTTTIGFGAAPAPATNSTAIAPKNPPMMIVKKKKKRTEDALDQKMPAQPDEKRAKTE
eukprot:scaffold97237_cov50-Attheya_sp.AAC.2